MGLKLENDIEMSFRKITSRVMQELTTEELTELHYVSQQELVEESLSEEEVTAKQKQSSCAIREILKAWETVAWYIEKHQPNKAVYMSATNLLMIMLCRIFVKF
ncbi:hypothetical protein AVEN_130399-1 [Araneus ventricosus]|uniref:Uncharacterized protein n=1 Tax=Araneus ventricosus TaxID=182803 RepID=A0A4Y2BEX7_ARAVE|nr:hypothetical protein AVEN_130399-1 [Araneus ventricosus]